MLNQKITFVLGAGASKEFGFPLGAELQRKVLDIAAYEIPNAQGSSGMQIWDPSKTPVCCAMKELGHTPSDTRKALDRIAEGVVEAPSIDTFLHNNKSDRAVVDCGKLAITHAVLLAERDCSFFWEEGSTGVQGNLTREDIHSIQSAKVRDTYLSPIWGELCQDHSQEDVGRIFENISVINFNYDRSLEEAFAFKLRANFGVGIETAREIVDTLDVIRPYGSPHGSAPYSKARMPLKRRASIPLHDSAKNIRTFTEAVHDDVRERIRDQMACSGVVVFLGFGFHRQNVDLFVGNRKNAPKVVFSFLGGSKENAEKIEQILRERIGWVGNYQTTHTYDHLIGTSVETLRHFQFPIFRSA